MKADVTIKGLSPLLMHRYPLGEAEGFEKWEINKKAEWAAYRGTDGVLFVPAENVYRCLVSAATYAKGKGRGNLSRVVAGSVSVEPAILSLGTKEYEIDIRNVRIPATRGTVPRVRPILNQWKLSFVVEWDDTLMTEKQARDVVDIAGKRVGLLDYRPEKKGPFGRFMVVDWSVPTS